MPDTSGPSSLTPLAFYDPDSSCWRMSAGTFPWEPPPSLETLPASGMTLAGRLYELPMSEPATAVPASSSLLPTPAANQFETEDIDQYLERRERCKETKQNGNGFGLVLGMVVRMLPTPSAADGLGGHERRGGDRGDELLLAGLVKDVLLPTPTTEPATGNGHARNLSKEARMLPTPTRRDHKGHNQRHDETCLTGALTVPPSPATPLPSDDLPLTLWTAKDD